MVFTLEKRMSVISLSLYSFRYHKSYPNEICRQERPSRNSIIYLEYEKPFSFVVFYHLWPCDFRWLLGQSFIPTPFSNCLTIWSDSWLFKPPQNIRRLRCVYNRTPDAFQNFRNLRCVKTQLDT